MHFDNQTKKGFTLIELLVVIAIIAILSVIGMTQFARAREKARDSERRIDMSQIQHAFISYYDDHNQHYPLVADVTQDPIIPDHSLTPTEAASGIFATGGLLIPAYLDHEFVDSQKGADGHGYHYVANCDTTDCVGATGATDYVFYTQLEVGGFYYALNPTGRISDVFNEYTVAPSCPQGTGNCTPPS